MMSQKTRLLSALVLSSLVLSSSDVFADQIDNQAQTPSQAETSTGISSSLNILALKSNTYDSLAGTWQDEFGGQMGIRADGHLYTRGANGGYLTLAGFDRQTETGSLLFKLMGQPDNQPTTIKLELVPAGQSASLEVDTSDQTKDRLILSGIVYYKVSTKPYWETEEFKAVIRGEEVSEKAESSTSDEISDSEVTAQKTELDQDKQDIPATSENQPSNQEDESTSGSGQVQAEEELSQPAMETENSPKDSASMVKEDSQPVEPEVTEPSTSPTTESQTPSQDDETKSSSTVKGTTTDSTDKATNSNSQAPVKQEKATGVAGAGQSNQTKSIQKSGQLAQSTNGAATSQKTKATVKSLPKTGDQSSGLLVTLGGLLLGLLALGRNSLSSRD